MSDFKTLLDAYRDACGAYERWNCLQEGNYREIIKAKQAARAAIEAHVEEMETALGTAELAHHDECKRVASLTAELAKQGDEMRQWNRVNSELNKEVAALRKAIAVRQWHIHCVSAGHSEDYSACAVDSCVEVRKLLEGK